MPPLYVKHRPETWEQVVGQDKLIAKLRRLRGFGGRAFWLYGPSGCGKSTLAMLIAREIASEFGIEDLDAAGLTAAAIQDLERRCAVKCMGKKTGRAIIVNEAQGLRRDAIKQLLVTLERIPAHVCWCFTTIDQDDSLFGTDIKGHPLLSRCLDCRVEGSELEFAVKAREIAQAENMDGKPLDTYINLVRRHKCNLRAILNAVEMGDF